MPLSELTFEQVLVQHTDETSPSLVAGHLARLAELLLQAEAQSDWRWYTWYSWSDERTTVIGCLELAFLNWRFAPV